MKDIWIGYIYGTVVTFLITAYVLLQEVPVYNNLRKSEWSCVQSRILDSNNVDKVECIVYKKQIDAN